MTLKQLFESNPLGLINCLGLYYTTRTIYTLRALERVRKTVLGFPMVPVHRLFLREGG